MKKYIIALFTISCIAVFINSCGNKTSKTTTEETSTIEGEQLAGINIQETHFDNNWNKLHDKQSLSKAEYDSLKLGSLSFINEYGDLEYEIGNILIDQENKKLLTVKAISSEEIAEYLLGYINNNITDSLLVTYEDVVEYYSSTSSIIANNRIEVLTINWNYNGMEEISDTIKTSYIITDSLKFDEIIDN